ncbi:hypothetical protein J3E69DRAFT_319560 [Trichoderma sp. SZMC 28015]
MGGNSIKLLPCPISTTVDNASGKHMGEKDRTHGTGTKGGLERSKDGWRKCQAKSTYELACISTRLPKSACYHPIACLHKTYAVSIMGASRQPRAIVPRRIGPPNRFQDNSRRPETRSHRTRGPREKKESLLCCSRLGRIRLWENRCPHGPRSGLDAIWAGIRRAPQHLAIGAVMESKKCRNSPLDWAVTLGTIEGEVTLRRTSLTFLL